MKVFLNPTAPSPDLSVNLDRGNFADLSAFPPSPAERSDLLAALRQETTVTNEDLTAKGDVALASSLMIKGAGHETNYSLAVSMERHRDVVIECVLNETPVSRQNVKAAREFESLSPQEKKLVREAVEKTLEEARPSELQILARIILSSPDLEQGKRDAIVKALSENDRRGLIDNLKDDVARGLLDNPDVIMVLSGVLLHSTTLPAHLKEKLKGARADIRDALERFNKSLNQPPDKAPVSRPGEESPGLAPVSPFPVRGGSVHIIKYFGEPEKFWENLRAALEQFARDARKEKEKADKNLDQKTEKSRQQSLETIKRVLASHPELSSMLEGMGIKDRFTGAFTSSPFSHPLPFSSLEHYLKTARTLAA